MSKSAPFLGFGVGLRPQHYDFLLENKTEADWLEIISENYMSEGGKPLAVLMKLREVYPIAMHGVSLSIGSVDPLNFGYLEKLKDLADKIGPVLISDHLCWAGFGGHNAHDLLPLPYTEEAIAHVVERVQKVQDFLARPIALENVSNYIQYRHSTMPEWEFLAAITDKADCGILLDVNNIYVNSVNHHFDPKEFLLHIPAERVWQYHLAGHSNQGHYLLDTHDHAIIESVWDLYRQTVMALGRASTLIEWDDNIPDFPILEKEVIHAKKIAASI